MVTEDSTCEIGADELHEKIAQSAIPVDSGIIASFLQEEIANKGSLDTCGLSPAGITGIYGTGPESLAESQLLEALPEAPEIPKMGTAYASAAQPADSAQDQAFEIADAAYQAPIRSV